MRLLIFILTLSIIVVSRGFAQGAPAAPDGLAGIDAEIRHNKGTGEFYVRSISRNWNESGLHPGDVIVKVGGIETAGLTAAKMEELINGKAGTELVLWVRPPGKEEIAEVILIRGEFGKDMRAFFGEGVVAPKLLILEGSPEMDRTAASRIITEENRAGLGAAVKLNDAAELEIMQVIKDSGAEEAGLKEGDVILKVDGADIARKPVDYSVSLLRGRAGSNVTVWIRAKGKGDIEEVVVTRKVIDPAQIKGATVEKNEFWQPAP